MSVLGHVWSQWSDCLQSFRPSGQNMLQHSIFFIHLRANFLSTSAGICIVWHTSSSSIHFMVIEHPFSNLILDEKYKLKHLYILKNRRNRHYLLKKSRIWETPTLSTEADSRTNTNLKRLRDLFIYFYFLFISFFCFFVDRLRDKFLFNFIPCRRRRRQGAFRQKRRRYFFFTPMRGFELIMWSQGQWEA